MSDFGGGIVGYYCMCTHTSSAPPPPSLQNVSNKPFTDAEIERYHRHCGRTDGRPISKQQAAETKKRLNDAFK